MKEFARFFFPTINQQLLFERVLKTQRIMEIEVKKNEK